MNRKMMGSPYAPSTTRVGATPRRIQSVEDSSAVTGNGSVSVTQ